MHPREGGQADVPGRLGLLDRDCERGGAVLVVPRLALRAAEARELVGLRLREAEPARRLRRLAEVTDGIVEPELDPRELAEHRVAADVQPRVVDELEPVLDLIPCRVGAGADHPAEIAAREANNAFAAWSHGRSSPS